MVFAIAMEISFRKSCKEGVGHFHLGSIAQSMGFAELQLCCGEGWKTRKGIHFCS